jgi:hypothetical protein
VRALTELLRLPRRSPLHPELARALSAADAVHALESDLEPVPVRATSTTSQSGCYRLRDGDPVDLRVSSRHDRLALSFLHELGHFVDHQLGHELGPTWASGRHDAFADWRQAVSTLPSRLPAGVGRTRRRYFDSTKELCARSYAQAVLTQAEDPLLRGHLAGLIEADDVFVWPVGEFEPVGEEVVRTFARLGLLRRSRSVAA